MGKRKTTQGSCLKVSTRPQSSLLTVGCFMTMTREPSERTTFFASTSVQATTAPRNVRTMKPTYVPSVTVDLEVTLMF